MKQNLLYRWTKNNSATKINQFSFKFNTLIQKHKIQSNRNTIIKKFKDNYSKDSWFSLLSCMKLN